MTREELVARLLSRVDGILINSDAVPAGPDLVALVESAVAGTHAPDLYPLVEPFDGGALVELAHIDRGSTCVVAIAGPNGVEAALQTDDAGEADALYAGLATQLGILGETCESCGTPIPSVYQYCANCV